MYEELEMWNAEMAKTIDWIEENKLQAKIAKEFNLDEAINEQRKIAFDLKIKKAIKLAKWKKEFDEWAEELGEKNEQKGLPRYTEYVISNTKEEIK